MKNKFIVIEGTDCSGKETQSKLLVKKLNELQMKSIYFTFPVYESPTGKVVSWYLNKTEHLPEGLGPLFKEGADKVDPWVASCYYAADRRDNMDKITDALNQGYNVILDRYVYSNMAHQGGKLTDKNNRKQIFDKLEAFEFDILELPKPDETIFLHMPYEQACILKGNRTNLDDHEKNVEHLKRAEQTYLELSERYNFKYVSCVENNEIRSIENINEELLENIKTIIKTDSNIRK